MRPKWNTARPDDEPYNPRPSKTRRKQTMDRHQQLGELLLRLKPAHWAALPVLESLLAALREDARIHAQEAKRRHHQYIGKLMRQQDLDALLDHLETVLPPPAKMTPLATTIQRLLQEGEKAVQETVQRLPGCDRSYLRELVESIQEADAQSLSDESAEAQHQLQLYLREMQLIQRF